jgi:hypothetical protein
MQGIFSAMTEKRKSAKELSLVLPKYRSDQDAVPGAGK